MARTRKGRAPDGAGESVTIYFDKADRHERQALQMAQMLAARRGRRKDAVVAFLSALYEVYESTGEVLDAYTILDRLKGNPYQSALYPPKAETITPTRSAPKAAAKADKPLVTVAKESAKITADTIAKNFLSTNASFWD
jgi:hypothetical protein